MNTTYMNTTSKCPDFLEAPPNVTFPTCALGSCANNSAVMARCCTDTPIIPYYYDSGFPGAKNETSGWGSYCQMKDNVSAAVWENCVSFNGANGAIRWLSEEIANSPVLAPFRPLELVACGGFVAVTCLRNRSESHDLDYFLNKRTFGRQYDAVKTEMKRLIRKIADNLHFVPDWANDEITTFLSLLNNPEALFIESKQQGDVLHSDNNLVIYAAKWEWVLARKLKRLQRINRAQSPDDWLDCISIATLLYIKNGRSKLSPRILQRYDDTNRELSVLPETVKELTRRARESTNVSLFPYSVWFYTHHAFRYQWETGESIAHDLWPRRRGQIQVYDVARSKWRYYDCEKQKWV
ncbi:hypothetical protein D6C97_01894 [Aureobasidium pullulans]|nr:hypothetical protein D6C97_01894 [Aureobasidium pullulans]